MRPIATPTRFATGQAMVEYLIVSAVLVLALGIGMADDSSVLWQLIDAFHTAYRNFSYSISLPT
jgi:hypothetical protein